MQLKIKNKKIDISHVKAVIFDMDGTLIESEHIWAKAKKEIAHYAGIEITDDELNQFIGRGLNDFIDEKIKPKSKEERQNLNKKIQTNALENYASKIRVIGGAKDILKAFSLAGIRIAICSSGSMKAIKISLRALNAINLIEVIVSGDNLTIGKPDPLPYLLTLKKLNLKASETIVFEDTTSGLKSATEAGIQTIIVGSHPSDQKFSDSILIEPSLINFYLENI
ncbi:HAD family phosphatase [Amylibacter sp.]|nr:HAD family phosphatase [Amylibacter sp.]MDB9991356.1 HAD family phosphatase [Amylibacter sp.]